MIIACVGYWGSQVFYNSYLPEIAAAEDRDRISAKGFTYGYIGSVFLQLICFVFVLKHDMFGYYGGQGLANILSACRYLVVGFWTICINPLTTICTCGHR